MSVAFLVTLARALLVQACAEMVRFALTTMAPDIPALVCIVIGLVLGVAVVEIAVMLWHRGTGPQAGERSAWITANTPRLCPITSIRLSLRAVQGLRPSVVAAVPAW